MRNHMIISFLVLVCAIIFYKLVRLANNNLETYVVHVELPSASNLSTITDDLHGWYQTFLPTTTLLSTWSSGDHGRRIVYSYHHVFKGFAARLSPEDVKAMEKKAGFISARKEEILHLHTTHTPNFLGLNQNSGFWVDSNYGKGIIIAVLDTGITPGHPSFNDEGMPPPPARWRRQCDFNSTTGASCNNKIIGSRYFTDEGNWSSFDEIGHGTHVASTAAGNFVGGANVFGNANGAAAGIAPHAHIAVYKVCSKYTEGTCRESAVLAGMDAAIDDGVDVLSLSLGWIRSSFYEDNIAIGAFSAVEKGIFVSASAGNYGPNSCTITNGAPWILTVGASSHDRKIGATAVLGNNEELHGESTFQSSSFPPSSLLPLTYPGKNSSNGTFCLLESLSYVDVRGKIVLCEVGGGIGNIEKGQVVRNQGGAAMILINQRHDGYTVHSESHVLPATHLSYADGLRIKAYLSSTSNPMATISFRGTLFDDNHAPSVASFSSRGPNAASLGILKPDIVGPGLNILAAWHESVENKTDTKSNFNIISGTSMACPHLSGVAALLKKVHPCWSPATIKSAIMTTADRVNLGGTRIEDETLMPANFFAVGSGHVNISRAKDPGLVYDIHPEDYLAYLCGLNYTDKQVRMIVSHDVQCSGISSISEAELNYPSFSVFLRKGSESKMYHRTVTNVGEDNSIYSVGIVGLPGVEWEVEPNTLRFSELNQKLTYQVTFSRLADASSDAVPVEGFLTWTSAKHSVRSPIVVFL